MVRMCRDAVLSGADPGVVSGGSVEPPKLNVKTYNKCVVKMEKTAEQLNHFKLPLKTLEIVFQRP